MREIEGDKLYTFMLASSNPLPVLLVKSPADNKAMKTFLGYEWSSRKGDEGIKYIGTTTSAADDEDEALFRNRGISQIKTPLFNPADLSAQQNINALIRATFNGEQLTIPDSLSGFVSRAPLTDMLDFSRVTFDKAFKTTVSETKSELTSTFPLVKLEELAEISRGASPRPISRFLTTDATGVNWIKIGDVAPGEKYITQTKERITQDGAKKSKPVIVGDFVISNSMSVGRPYILKISGCIHDGWLLMSRISDKLNKDFFYYILTTDAVQNQFSEKALGGVVSNLNTERVAGVRIPLPPLEIQRRIIAECEAVDTERETARKCI